MLSHVPIVPTATGFVILAASGATGLDPAWIALIGTIFGGVGLKVVEHFLTKNSVKVTEATQMRDELRRTSLDQKAEIRHLEKEVDDWRQKYYDLRDEYSELHTKMLFAMAKIKDTTEEVERDLE